MQQRGAPDTGALETVLGVSRSALGRRWVERRTDPSEVLQISQALRAPEIIARLLHARGVGARDAERFLNPSLKSDLPDPSVIRDMDLAVDRLAAAIVGGEGIAIFGDYDVDGATSSALLARYLSDVGAQPVVYIPDRMTEGYGPNPLAMQRLAAEGAKVIVTVDCGTQAHEALAAAAGAGADVIICDHHLPAETLPRACAIVNPNRRDDTSGLGQLAAIGVTFMLCVALNRELRTRGFFESRPMPDLRRWLGIVALGTVADVVPLTGLNRAFVMRGIEQLHNGAVPGLAVLAEVGRLSGAIEPYHLGFVLGPRVNAGGRVGRCDLGSRLLATDSRDEALAIAQELDALNHERRAIEQAIQLEAFARVEADPGLRASPVILVHGHGWHPGVIGIVASRLKDKYAKPSIVVAVNDGVGKGSGRSVTGVDLGSAIVAAREQGLLVNGGGHAMAAGLTVDPLRIADLHAFLCSRLAQACAVSTEGRELVIDGAVSVAGATQEFCALVARCGPYGAGNAEPVFVIPSLSVAWSSVVAGQHVRCTLQSQDGARLGAIAFKSVETELGAMLLRHAGRRLHVAATLKVDSWQGQRRVQAVIRDAALAL